MIGHELGGRYQIIERIGGGGMALVYRAQDILLGRNVAIKVLRQQFVHDEEFIRRFRREAQSAASLSHPNVVSIYDVGQEEDIHYIVMEYIEGHNLNEIIKDRAPLQVDEAVRITAQIADALDHAHQNQIIHRDIKPHNILIGRNGRVKVTDFGIARAASAATITQTGSVVGSVHYFSPEHAKGVVTGEKSDLYSLGIVLYEMLTGKVPFHGESPISVALKHLQEPFEEPRLINPLIPQSVENIILKSMRKNPGERYQSAKEMLRDLETCLLPERRRESKILFSDLEDADKTRVIPAIKPQPRTTGGKSSREMNKEDTDPTRKKTWVKPVIWAGITLFIIVFMLGVAWYVKSNLKANDNVQVPNVINMQENAARAELAKVGLIIQEPVKREYRKDVATGTVYFQSKPQGTEVLKGSSIEIGVGKDKPLEKVPDLKGLSYDEAHSKLISDYKMTDSQISRIDTNSDEVTMNKVITQNPAADSEFDPAIATITLTVSKGRESVSMPTLIGLSQKEAEAKVKEVGLKIANDGIKQKASYTQTGKVIEQWPYAPNTPVNPGDEVILTISSGYPPEAISYTYNVPVSPEKDGKSSKIRIVYTDARGENLEWGTKTIKANQTMPIDLVLAPTKDGVVIVYRNGKFLDTYQVSYIDAKQGTVPDPNPNVPANTTPEPPQPDPNKPEDPVEGQTEPGATTTNP
ncbi:serine/threonine-protein kinase [Paenibacillus shirakamiensis]|uniref:non-specific serine/threonine protein kinase n=1 Tax=Paenibacillus shirakamiensis TaxID=1265935 RepID=A0ABS4JCB3_9BACL|nr:Stk1 family PASTA domain-containing Ser/Thr kinase [Paenibacillus shirakamiensis]MBP1999356.1 serine/threonine-protein kinase [Paenibacillus shirakamiensis]